MNERQLWNEHYKALGKIEILEKIVFKNNTDEENIRLKRTIEGQEIEISELESNVKMWQILYDTVSTDFKKLKKENEELKKEKLCQDTKELIKRFKSNNCDQESCIGCVLNDEINEETLCRMLEIERDRIILQEEKKSVKENSK